MLTSYSLFLALWVSSSSTLLGTASPTPLADGDWPAWRGAQQDGVGVGSPPVSFGEDENLKWKVELPGKGLSTPVIVGDRVFVTSAVSKGAPVAQDGGGGGGRRRGPEPVSETDFLVLAFDRNDGALLWERTARTQVPHQGTHRDGSLASPSIIWDGERLCASFGSYGIYAFDLEGELLWEVDLGDMEVFNSFGEGSSPAVCGDNLIVLWDHEGESALVALDRSTGKERWRTARDRGTNWATPLILEREGKSAAIVIASDVTVAYDADNGELLWSHGEAPAAEAQPEGGGGGGGGGRGRGGRGGRGDRRGGIIATPLLHDGALVVSTGTRNGGMLYALALSEIEAGETKADGALLWQNDRLAPRIPSPIAHEGIVYALKSTSGVLSAFDVQSGEELYTAERLDGVADVWASPIIAGGRIYVVGRDGTVEVLATGPEFESLAVNSLEETFDASPAVAGDELFLRGRSALYCFASAE